MDWPDCTVTFPWPDSGPFAINEFERVLWRDPEGVAETRWSWSVRDVGVGFDAVLGAGASAWLRARGFLHEPQWLRWVRPDDPKGVRVCDEIPGPLPCSRVLLSQKAEINFQEISAAIQSLMASLEPWGFPASPPVRVRRATRESVRFLDLGSLAPPSWASAHALYLCDMDLRRDGRGLCRRLEHLEFNVLVALGVPRGVAELFVSCVDAAEAWEQCRRLALVVPPADLDGGGDASFNDPPASLVGRSFRDLPNPFRHLLSVWLGGACVSAIDIHRPDPFVELLVDAGATMLLTDEASSSIPSRICVPQTASTTEAAHEVPYQARSRGES